MDHCRCFTVFNPKTRKSSIVNIFHWSECNRFSCPKITSEEQIATAAKDLAQAIKSKFFLHLPDKNLRTNVEKLCTMFEEASENIIVKKLTPLQTESSKVNSPQLEKETDFQPRVSKSPKSNSPSPTKNADFQPRVETSNANKLPTASIEPTHMPQRNAPLPHRYPTRIRTARAANVVQLEQAQINKPSPVTH